MKNKEQKILENLRKEVKDKTTIIISHRVSTLEKSDNIIVIDQGSIIENGTHKSLIKNKGFYSQMHENQSNNWYFIYINVINKLTIAIFVRIIITPTNDNKKRNRRNILKIR